MNSKTRSTGPGGASPGATRAGWVLVAMLSAIMGARQPAAAPEYALSGRAGELEQVILAETPAGAVSALDLLMFDGMSARILWDVPLEALLDPRSLHAERYQEKIRETVERLTVTLALAGQAGDWQPAEDHLWTMSFGAAQAAWIEQAVAPRVKVERADIHRYYLEHANTYLRRRQAQVRYIFKRADTDRIAETDAAREELENIAYRVGGEETDFATAAREQSDARSAEDGGLLPPFYDGTYNEEFEDNTFKLGAAGDLSPVFEGPGGLYLLQLVRAYPERNIPIEEVWDDIGRRLTNEHLKHYYQYEQAKFGESYYFRNFSPAWEYLHPDAPLAHVGPRQLTRQDFIRYYGNPTNPDYTVRWDVVNGGVADWIEGEIVTQELEKTGGLGHRWVQRARALATAILRARHAQAVHAPPAELATAAGAARWLVESGALEKYFSAYNLVAFEIAPDRAQRLTPAEQRAAARLADILERQLRQGTLKTEPTTMDLKAWRVQALAEEANGGEPKSSVATGRTGDENAPSKAIVDAVDDLEGAIATTAWPNVKLRVKALGWVVPGTDAALGRLLEGVAVGEVSRTQSIAPDRMVYLVMEKRPATLDAWAERPERLRQLAYDVAAEMQRRQERKRLVGQGAIRYPFE